MENGFPDKFDVCPTIKDVTCAVGAFALNMVELIPTMLPRRVLSPISDHFQRQVITRSTIPFEGLDELQGQFEGLED